MPQSRPWVSRAVAIAAVWLLALAPTAIAAGGADPGHKHKPVKKHASSKRSEREHEQSLKAFARKHRKLKHRLPIALVREKVQEQGEGAREILSGPAQVQVDQRAYPRHYVDDRIAAAGRQAFLANAGTAALATPWSELGPFTPAVAKEATYTGAPALNSGRVTAMAVDPNCGRAGSLCRMWIAAAGGGIFRTDDALAAHVVWTPADQGLTSDSFGSLIVDPTDASGNTLYAGSGEANGSSDSEAGVGLFKSTDGGQSWSLVPGSPAVAENRSIGAIAIDPDDGTLYIGTGEARHGLSSTTSGRRTPPNAPQLGLYKSTDGGQSFTLAFSRSGSGDPAKGTDVQRGGVNKIVIDPTAPAGRNDPRPIYVGFFGYGIWRSAPSLEGGDAGFKQVFATLFPADPLGDRTEFDLAALPDGKTRAYVGDGSAGSGEAHPPTSEFWRSDDVDQPAANLVAGAANRAPWTKLSSSDPSAPGFASYNFCEGQCWYDEFVAADPSDPDIVFLGGSMQYDDLQVFGGDQRTNGRAVIRSTDAGETFNDMTNDATVDAGADTSLLAGGVTGMHPDQHAIAFDPFNPRFFFVGSDGGVIRVNGQYTNRTADCAARQLSGDALALCRQVLRSVPVRSDWLNDGLRTLQYQGVSLNPADPGSDLLGGTQDNGTWAFNPSAGAPGGFDAFESVGGDGGVSSIGVDQVKVHTYYGPTMDANFGGNEGDTDSPRTWDYISEPLDAAAGDPDNPEAFAFYVPLIHDPSPSRKGTLFTGGQFVWRTTDNGGPSDQLDAHCRETALSVGDSSRVCGDWQRIGRRLSAGATQAEGAGDYVVAVERAPSNDQTLWAGTRQGHLWISRNANAADPAAVQFTEVDAAGLPGRFPSSITIDPGNPNHAWVSYSGYSAYTPTTPGHVFDVRVNPDTGAATAVDLSFDLGDQPVTDVVRDDQTGALYASTDFGVLTLALNGTSWTKAADGMPIVAVYGLTIDPGTRLLYAATHGRGVWRVNLPGGTAPATVAPTPGPGVAALSGAAATGPSAGPSPAQAASRSRRARVSGISLRREGGRVTVRFRVNRVTKVRVQIKDRRGRVIGHSPLRAARPGHQQAIHVRIPRATRGRLRAVVTSMPEAPAGRTP